MPIESEEFRVALGKFATGICLITRPKKENDTAPTGIVVNSFTSVSLDPPRVLWCLDKNSNRFEPFMECDSFGVNILAADQRDLSDGFTGGTLSDFDEIKTESWATGAALLPASMVNMECAVVDRVECGDHFIIVGEVSRIRINDSASPLVYHMGQYRRLDEKAKDPPSTQ